MKKHNFEILENAGERPDEVPLVTVSNHTSCLDDPCLWGKNIFLQKTITNNLTFQRSCLYCSIIMIAKKKKKKKQSIFSPKYRPQETVSLNFLV